MATDTMTDKATDILTEDESGLITMSDVAIQQLTKHLGNPKTKDPLGRAANRQDSTLLIDRNDGIGRRFLDDFVAVF